MEPHTSSYLSRYIIKLFRLHRRLRTAYVDYAVVYARGQYCWPDLLIKSTVEPKRCLILDVRKSSLVEDRRVPENRNEFPFPPPSCLYGAIFPLLLLCLPREFSSIVRENLS